MGLDVAVVAAAVVAIAVNWSSTSGSRCCDRTWPGSHHLAARLLWRRCLHGLGRVGCEGEHQHQQKTN